MFDKTVPAKSPVLTNIKVPEPNAANEPSIERVTTYISDRTKYICLGIAASIGVACSGIDAYQDNKIDSLSTEMHGLVDEIVQISVVNPSELIKASANAYRGHGTILEIVNPVSDNIINSTRKSQDDLAKMSYQTANILTQIGENTNQERNSVEQMKEKIDEIQLEIQGSKEIQSKTKKGVVGSLIAMGMIALGAISNIGMKNPLEKSAQSQNTTGRKENDIQDGGKVIPFEPKIVRETGKEDKTYADFRNLPENKTPIVIPAIVTAATTNLPKSVLTATSQPIIKPTATEIESQLPKVPLIKRDTEIQENLKKIHLCAFEAMLQISGVDNKSVIEFVNRLKDTDIDLNDVINPGSNYEDMFSLYIIYSLGKTPQQIPINKMRGIDLLINEFKQGRIKHSNSDSKLSEIIGKMPIAA